MATLERVKKVVSTHDLRHNLVDATAPQVRRAEYIHRGAVSNILMPCFLADAGGKF
jgi:hypothetical protein